MLATSDKRQAADEMAISLKDIYGQSEIIAQLESASRAGRLAHAYLFWGPEGVGKSTLARAVIKGLLCDEAGGLASCGCCPSCRQAEAGSHPDVMIIEPESPAGAIGIEAVRAVQARASLKPFRGTKKVVLVRRADLMTPEASHALLKSLEEPDPGMYWILTARHLRALPATVRSRTQPISVRPLPEEELAAILGGRGMGAGEAQTCARLAEGSVGKALRLCEAGEVKWKNRWIDSFLVDRELLAGSSRRAPWRELEKLERAELEKFLDLFAQWFRDLLVCSESVKGVFPLNGDREDALRSEKARYTHEELIQLIEVVAEGRNLLDRNVNTKVLIGWLEQTISEILCPKSST
ncbi:MAG: DNA polymerase III subunit delta' [Candidatus Omnitrophica bacterium]|nr:DNA polymerase III subunit delta' [Candidatus Omnitrophota bacterium]